MMILISSRTITGLVPLVRYRLESTTEATTSQGRILGWYDSAPWRLLGRVLMCLLSRLQRLTGLRMIWLLSVRFLLLPHVDFSDVLYYM